jgi:UDP-glucose:(heptosyl)LPS alpha-1,3-glucosyltransferase
MEKHNRKLKIAVLVRKLTFAGGSYRYAAEVTRRLVERGHQVDVYAREADAELLEGLTFNRVPTRMTFSSVLSTVAFARDTAGMLRGRKYDVVQSHERAMSQDVMTLHCFSYKGGVGKYSAIRKIDMVYLSPRSWLYLWLERRQMRSPWLVSVSDIVRRETRELYKHAENIEVIPPGVDAAQFDPEWVARERDGARKKLGVQEGEMVILFVGTEFRRKGLDRLIPAIGPGMRLFVVGLGERLRYFRRLARQGGPSGRVHFEGWQEDVRSYYAAADVVALPSRSEAFGLSILEGMACGLPVLASPNSGVAELITDGVNGYKAAETREISEVLSRLKDSGARSSIGARARQTAEEHTWDEVADRHEELFLRIAAQKHGH